MFFTKNIKLVSCYFNKYIYNTPLTYCNIFNNPIKAYHTNLKRDILCLDIICDEYTYCNYCKGSGRLRCVFCKGISKKYKNAKEYKCNKCCYGGQICFFCNGSGISHSIF
jgi:hypothetical protein